MSNIKKISDQQFEHIYEDSKEIAPESDDEFIAALTSSMMLEEGLFITLTSYEYNTIANGLSLSLDKSDNFREYMYYMINYGYKSLIVVNDKDN